MKSGNPFSLSGVLTIAVLLSLAVINVLWFILRWHGGALLALVFYASLSFVCIRRRHYEAGVIAGVLGFGIHLLEFFVPGRPEFVGMERYFFYGNLMLPLPLAALSFVAARKGNNGRREVDGP